MKTDHGPASLLNKVNIQHKNNYLITQIHGILYNKQLANINIKPKHVLRDKTSSK